MKLPCDDLQPRNPTVNNYVLSKYVSELITEQLISSNNFLDRYINLISRILFYKINFNETKRIKIEYPFYNFLSSKIIRITLPLIPKNIFLFKKLRNFHNLINK